MNVLSNTIFNEKAIQQKSWHFIMNTLNISPKIANNTIKTYNRYYIHYTHCTWPFWTHKAYKI